MVSGSRSAVSTLGANYLLLSLSPCSSGDRAAEGWGPGDPEWCRFEAWNGRVCAVAVRHGQSIRVPRQNRDRVATDAWAGHSQPDGAGPPTPGAGARARTGLEGRLVRSRRLHGRQAVAGATTRPVKTHYPSQRLRGAT